MLTATVWYSWHHPEQGQAYSLSLSRRAPIMVWKKELQRMVKVARVGKDEGWQQTEFKKVNGRFEWIPVELADEEDS